MADLKRLPDSEFEIMEIIWDNPSLQPMTTLQIMGKMKPERKVKLQTLLTMLLRLMEKGFLISERIGRERNYTPIILKKDYMKVETATFMSRHYINSISALVKTFYEGQKLSSGEIKNLKEWLDKNKKE